MMRSAICRSKIDGLRKLQFVIETASALLLGINKVIKYIFWQFQAIQLHTEVLRHRRSTETWTGHECNAPPKSGCEED